MSPYDLPQRPPVAIWRSLLAYAAMGIVWIVFKIIRRKEQ